MCLRVVTLCAGKDSKFAQEAQAYFEPAGILCKRMLCLLETGLLCTGERLVLVMHHQSADSREERLHQGVGTELKVSCLDPVCPHTVVDGNVHKSVQSKGVTPHTTAYQRKRFELTYSTF